jgi:hypothetical protein
VGFIIYGEDVEAFITLCEGDFNILLGLKVSSIGYFLDLVC